METLTLSSAGNPIHHVAVAEDMHDHSPIDEEQMINFSDITDFSQEIQQETVTMPIAKEVLLISLVSKEQALYNPKHENYRNTQRKDMKWFEISEHIGWTELQCKAKWKAMRDQYCRELKRSKFNSKANVKWKYFKELEFLRPFALARNYRPRLPPAINNNNNNNNNNHNDNFICTSVNPNDLVNIADDGNNSPKFSTIKIEGSNALNFTCDFDSNKSNTSNNLSEEQFSSVLQQTSDNWTYITGSKYSSVNNTNLENHSIRDGQHLLTPNHHHNGENQQQTTDEAVLYNVLVDCMGQMQDPQSAQQHEQQQLCQQQTAPINEEEDEDPIHTFLNIESYFEKELIALVRGEDMLYDNCNPNYRNVKLKLVIWSHIARKLKKTVKQCRLKWKALRDQFIREHKRLRDLDNIAAMPKWKHYEALSFLQMFIKHKRDCSSQLTFSGDFESHKNLLEITKTKLEPDTFDCSSSPLRSPLHQLSAINSAQRLQQETVSPDNLCVNTASVGGYDDMDIENYIIGDSGSVVDEPNGLEDNEADSEEDKPQQKFSAFNNHNRNINNEMEASTSDPTNRTFKEEHTQIQQHHQEHHQTQPINMPSLDLNDATPNNLLNDRNLASSPTSANNNSAYQHQNLLSSNNHIDLTSAATTLNICSATGHLPPLAESQSLSHPPTAPPPISHQTPTTLEASTNTHPMQDNSNNSTTNNANNITNTSNVNMISTEEDEVGAFFKAVAMKIRNANLSQVALTDLEIDILRVINTSLRNH